MKDESVIRWFQLLRLWAKSYGVTIQVKPLQQYFHMVLFIYSGPSIYRSAKGLRKFVRYIEGLLHRKPV